MEKFEKRFKEADPNINPEVLKKMVDTRVKEELAAGVQTIQPINKSASAFVKPYFEISIFFSSSISSGVIYLILIYL